MGRKTKFNKFYDPEIVANFNKQNKFLLKSFEEYLRSVDKASTTIEQYISDLRLFFCWNAKNNYNKPFTEISKRDYTKFQGNALSIWEWSPARIRRVKAVISSLSNYIENILDEEEEFKGFHSVIKKIESPVSSPVREKTVFTPEELQHLLDTLVKNEKYEQACALSLAMCSARRKAELARFKVSYFTEDTVLYGTLYKTPEKVVTKGRGSKGKPLNLYILKTQFDPYLKLWLNDRKERGIESVWLFPNLRHLDKHVDRTPFDNWAKLFTKLTGKDFYWHSVRHYATTQFIKNNIPLHIIKEMIGWESVDMVNIYNDSTTDDMLKEYFDKEKNHEEV